MSGHSHARTVKRRKDLNAQKRGRIFSKMARSIWVAVKEGGSNPETNSKLRFAIEMARSFNMPNENVESAIKRATGEIPSEKLEEVIYEAYGPGGIALILEGITDNKNRALGEIKQTLNQYNGKLVAEGAVKWMFERKGCLTVSLESQTLELKKEDFEMAAIESGAQDLYWHDTDLDVYTEVGDLEKVRSNLEQREIKIDSVSLDWKPKEMIDAGEKDKEACLKLFEALDELDSVQNIYSNLKL